MKVLVCGGRDYKEVGRVFEVLDIVHQRKGITCIINGGANGADSLARIYAADRGFPLVTMPANWKMFGKGAGPIRNQSMIDVMKPDACIAFPGGNGTRDMINRCIKADIKLWVIEAYN